ncbi:MAG: nucleoside hydrolase, partial [Gammaproteobacteria bacterium]|nr:nucleoside hydrolase [Gammaproteobacteria bacterium]
TPNLGVSWIRKRRPGWASLRQHNKTVLFVLGPWTNIAAVYRNNPQLFKNSIKAIYSADGILSANTINHEPGTKRKYFRGTWNLHIDPRAGQIVFASGVPIKLITTDARARLNPLSQLPIYEKYIRIKNHQTNNYAKLVAMVLQHKPAWFISDQVAAVTALYPQICSWKQYNIRVNIKPRSHAGETVPDPDGNKIWLCLYIKKNLYQNLFINGLTNRK